MIWGCARDDGNTPVATCTCSHPWYALFLHPCKLRVQSIYDISIPIALHHRAFLWMDLGAFFSNVHPDVGVRCGARRLGPRTSTSASSPCARSRFRAQLRRIGVHVQHDLSCSRSSSRLRVHDHSDYRDIPGCAALQLICSFVHVGSGAGGGRGRGVGVAESQLARWPLAAIRVWLRSFLGSRGFGESPSRKLPASRRHSLPTPSRARAAAAVAASYRLHGKALCQRRGRVRVRVRIQRGSPP